MPWYSKWFEGKKIKWDNENKINDPRLPGGVWLYILGVFIHPFIEIPGTIGKEYLNNGNVYQFSIPNGPHPSIYLLIHFIYLCTHSSSVSFPKQKYYSQ